MQIKEPIQGGRIRIRDYHGADLPFVTGMWFDGENGKYMSDPAGREFIDDVYQKALDEMENNPEGYYLVIEAGDTAAPIGTCCMFPDEAKEVYDIGYCIHKERWRQGYGSEAVALLIGWIRAHGGKAVTAEVAKENPGSNRLLQKLGFEVAGESKFEKYRMGISYESYLYRLALK